MALSAWGTRMVPKPLRIIRYRKNVEMPWYEVVPAIVITWIFYTTVMLAQLGSAMGFTKPGLEQLPVSTQ